MSSEKPTLPTGKSHLSFSELKCWSECSFKHKLVHIDKLGVDRPSIYSDFGTITHDAGEEFLKTRVVDKQKAIDALREVWTQRGYPNVPDWPKKMPTNVEGWISFLDFMDDIPAFMDTQFPGWEYVSAEEALFEPIAAGCDVQFKGYVDCIIRVKDKKGKDVLWIIDWKTAGDRGWHRQKKQDPLVQMQLRLYKIFWSRREKVPMKDVRCAFVILKRGAKKNRCDLVTVSVGDKTAAREEHRLQSAITAIKSSRFLKNRYSCTYCEFADTPHCKRNL